MRLLLKRDISLFFHFLLVGAIALVLASELLPQPPCLIVRVFTVVVAEGRSPSALVVEAIHVIYGKLVAVLFERPIFPKKTFVYLIVHVEVLKVSVYLHTVC